MNTHERVLEVACDLLARSREADFATRDVCLAAGVAAPALYRMFGDKDRLLAATVDHAFEQYLTSKRAAKATADPVRDLKRGWDDHIAFAREHPNAYKLMYAPGLSATPQAVADSHELLREVINRIALAGRLALPVDLATRIIMSANVGVALSLLYRPETHPDLAASDYVRDAVVDAITTPGSGQRSGSAAAAAIELDAQLRHGATDGMTCVEVAMMRQWLSQLADAGVETDANAS